MDPLVLLSDPASAGIVVGTAALILFSAAWHKFSEPNAFLSALAAYRLVPAGMLDGVARAIPAVEAALGAALLFPVTRSAALIGGALLFAAYAAAMAVNVLRCRSYIDCGCGGTSHPLSWGLVVRNVVLTGTMLAVAGPTTDRPLGWLDAVTLIAGVLAFYAAYLATDELLRQASRMARAEHGSTERSSLS